MPHDSDQIMFYKEDKRGQILEEGINESGAMSAWIACATAYSNYRVPMVPFYIYYSMFGFQRIGDLAWLAGDIQARGFLIGATAGRTTLNGEGLQHQDGHSHILANTIPNCRSYDPTYGYELAVIIQDGMKRMYENKENCFYYITTMNENYVHPDMPAGAEAGIVRGIYKLHESKKKRRKSAVNGRGYYFARSGSRCRITARQPRRGIGRVERDLGERINPRCPKGRALESLPPHGKSQKALYH